MLHIISKFVCFNQSELFDYKCVLKEKEQKLKEALVYNEKNYIAELYKDYTTFAVSELIQILKYNIENYVKPYFQKDNAIPPRVSIKLYDNGSVLTVVHTNKDLTECETPLKNIESDYVLKNTIALGKDFVSNDIANLILTNKEFSNPRFKEEELSHYRLTGLEEDFKKIWKEYDTGIYYSTLVVPMAMKNDKYLNPITKEVFFKNEKDDIRKIFGLVCVDHIERNYFSNEKESVDAAYIFSDILTQYLMVYFTMLTDNELVEKVKNIN